MNATEKYVPIRGLKECHRMPYVVNSLAADDMRKAHGVMIEGLPANSAFYVFVAGAQAVGFVGPDTLEFYAAIRERFLLRHPVRDDDIPVLETTHIALM